MTGRTGTDTSVQYRSIANTPFVVAASRWRCSSTEITCGLMMVRRRAEHVLRVTDWRWIRAEEPLAHHVQRLVPMRVDDADRGSACGEVSQLVQLSARMLPIPQRSSP